MRAIIRTQCIIKHSIKSIRSTCIMQLLKSQTTFNTRKHNYFTTHLKPVLRYLEFCMYFVGTMVPELPCTLILFGDKHACAVYTHIHTYINGIDVVFMNDSVSGFLGSLFAWKSAYIYLYSARHAYSILVYCICNCCKKRANTSGVRISNIMRKSIYLLTTAPTNQTYTF